MEQCVNLPSTSTSTLKRRIWRTTWSRENTEESFKLNILFAIQVHGHLIWIWNKKYAIFVEKYPIFVGKYNIPKETIGKNISHMIIHKLSQMLKLIRLWLFYLKRFYFLVYILSTLGTEKDPLMNEKALNDCQL